MRVRTRPISTIESAEHAAVRAWTSLCNAPNTFARVETLRERKNALAAVYRLTPVDACCSPIVAKRCGLADAQHERTWYEQILPHLPLTTVKYHGFVADLTNSLGWIFLDDAGDISYSPKLQHHRALASTWLGILHAQGGHFAGSFALPDRGVDWYRTRLSSAVDLLEQALGGGAIADPDAAQLARLAKWCMTTQARWPEVVQFCGSMPCTFVHADFVGENVRVRQTEDGLTLLPFDWGTAGWGIPARDLVGLDVGCYHAAVRDWWPAISEADIRGLVRIGRLFRKIAAVHRACMSLPYATVQKVLSDLQFLLVRA